MTTAIRRPAEQQKWTWNEEEQQPASQLRDEVTVNRPTDRDYVSEKYRANRTERTERGEPNGTNESECIGIGIGWQPELWGMELGQPGADAATDDDNDDDRRAPHPSIDPYTHRPPPPLRVHIISSEFISACDAEAHSRTHTYVNYSSSNENMVGCRRFCCPYIMRRASSA